MDGTQLLEGDTLPNDLTACHTVIQVLRAEREQFVEQLRLAGRKLSQMEHQLGQLLRRLYGRSSEKIDPRQMALFAEMLQELETQNPSVQEAPIEPPAAWTAAANPFL